MAARTKKKASVSIKRNETIHILIYFLLAVVPVHKKEEILNENDKSSALDVVDGKYSPKNRVRQDLEAAEGARSP